MGERIMVNGRELNFCGLPPEPKEEYTVQVDDLGEVNITKGEPTERLMSLSKDDWELALEGMSECPKCGGKSGVYTRALIGETATRLFGCADVDDCEHSIIRGGTVFYCIDCDRPLFDRDGKTR